MISGNFRWLAAMSTTELFSFGFPRFVPSCCPDCNLFFFLGGGGGTQNIRMSARKKRILPPDEGEDLHEDDSDFRKSFKIKRK